MPKFFVSQEQINEETQEIQIIGKDVNHLRNVLRVKIGNKIEISNEANQKSYCCQINEIKKEYIRTKIIEEIVQTVESNIKVSIFQGTPKSDKMEWIIQKAVELGAYDIISVEMQRCIVKLKEKDKEKKQQRWQRISEVAAKQCGRSVIPKIQFMKSVKSICQFIKEYDIVLVAYEQEKQKTLKEELLNIKQKGKQQLKIAIVIGPEGGIEENEIKELEQNGAKIVTLGKRILRTETVALQMVSVIMYELEK